MPFRRLVVGPPPAPERVFFFGVWFRGHNNPRYAELLPRLERLDRYLLTMTDRSPFRGAEFRSWRATRSLTDPPLFAAAQRRYRSLFTADNEQIAYWRGPIVSDVDDPKFTPREVELLRRRQLAAYVVTAERTARGLEALGLEKPWHVIPQGVSLRALGEQRVAAIAERHRRDGGPVVGYMAAFLLTSGDRGGERELYNVEHLLELWDEIHRRVPRARLWLLGEAGPGLRERVAGREDIVCFGRVPRDDVLAHVANFDVALYPRAADQGIQAAKVAEYLGGGAPIVSYDYEVVSELRGTGAAVLVNGARDFVEAVVRLLEDEGERGRLREAARRLGRERDWDELGRRYGEILDRYLS